MRTMRLGSSDLQVPVFAVGMMHINKVGGMKEAEEFIQTCLDLGCNFFDHADIYGMDTGPFGTCERIFSEAVHMTPSVREKMIIQTKCGFTELPPGEGKPKKIDNTKEYILKEADDSLKRLNTDYLDVYLLHAPDALMEPEEIAEAFDKLYESGKVRHFGVSNFNTNTMQLLQKYVKQPLVTNQLGFSIANAGLISQEMYVGMNNDFATDRDNGILNYCRMNDITVQCWGTMQYGYLEGCFLGNSLYPELNAKLEEMAEKYSVPTSAIAIAWILRHPAHMMPITGTKSVKHLIDSVKGADIKISHDDWYELWKAAGNFIR